MSTTAGHTSVAPVATPQKFDFSAPHGALICATLSGVQLQYADTMRGEMMEWLKSLPGQFEMASAAQGPKVVCPACGGKLQMVGDRPVPCVICRGLGYVSPDMAEQYQAGMGNRPMQPAMQVAPQMQVAPLVTYELVPEPPPVVRVYPGEMCQSASPIDHTSATIPVPGPLATDSEDFIGPREFIGPIHNPPPIG
jgi:hypothetical protein